MKVLRNTVEGPMLGGEDVAFSNDADSMMERCGWLMSAKSFTYVSIGGGC